MEALIRARALLENVTPLKSDCGALCGGACCMGSDEDGMVLLPHEDALYENANWCRVKKRDDHFVLICKGRCPRSDRPFACRIFPLYLHMTADRTTVALDPLSRAVCPLSSGGLKGLDRAFVQSAKEAFRLLLKEEEYRAFFAAQSALRDEAFADPLFRDLF